MAGYTRQRPLSIVNGVVIDADDLSDEFNKVEEAFSGTVGHTHDGSAANGSPITKVGPSQEVTVSSSAMLPKTTATVNLGSPTLKFKDLNLSGTLSATTIVGAIDASQLTSGIMPNARISGLDAAFTKLSGIETGATADQTASEILSLLKTVDVNGTAGVNAGTLGGMLPTATNTVSTIANRDTSGDLTARLFRSEWTPTNGTVNYIMTQITPGVGGDNFIRPSTPAQVLAGIGAASNSISVTAGNGLTGGGTLAASRTLTVGSGDGINVTTGAVGVDSTVVRTTRQVIAGNGLTGGAFLSANPTLTMGTPATITATSNNEVTSTSHSHSIAADAVRVNYAVTTAGEIGSVALLRYPANAATRAPNFAIAGSNLVYANVSGIATGGNPPGTWRLLGAIDGVDAERQTSLWLRLD